MSCGTLDLNNESTRTFAGRQDARGGGEQHAWASRAIVDWKLVPVRVSCKSAGANGLSSGSRDNSV